MMASFKLSSHIALFQAIQGV